MATKDSNPREKARTFARTAALRTLIVMENAKICLVQPKYNSVFLPQQNRDQTEKSQTRFL